MQTWNKPFNQPDDMLQPVTQFRPAITNCHFVSLVTPTFSINIAARSSWHLIFQSFPFIIRNAHNPANPRVTLHVYLRLHTSITFSEDDTDDDIGLLSLHHQQPHFYIDNDVIITKHWCTAPQWQQVTNNTCYTPRMPRKKYCKQIVQTVIIARYHQHMHVLSNNTRSHHHYFFLLLLFSLLCTEKQWEKNAKLEHRENDSFSLVLFFGPNEDSFFSLLFVFTGALPFLIRWFIFLVNGVSSSW